MYLLQVYVTNASLNINRPFTYISDEKIDPFCRVKIYFHKAVNNGIVAECEYTDKDLTELKEEMGYEPLKILEVIDESPIISKELFDLAFWLSKTTVSPFISCLNSMLPKVLKTSLKHTEPKKESRFHKIEGDYPFTKRQQEVYDSIQEGMLASQARKISAHRTGKCL